MNDFGGHNLPFVEDLYVQYLEDPASVDPEWRAVFDPISEGPTQVRPSVEARSIFNPASNGAGGVGAAEADLALQDKLDELTTAFRTYGHLEAMLDPLDRPRRRIDALNPLEYGITDSDLNHPVSTASLGARGLNIGQVLRRLRATYCRHIGVQFMHIDDPKARRWLQERMESTENRLRLSVDDQTKLLAKLTDAEVFEQFIRRKYLGAKSFSLEGGESLIPLLDLAIEAAAQQGVQEIVLGMAHRGRLSVLANIMKKHPREIFREFDDSDAETNPELYWGRGDVKYHLGFSSDQVTASGKPIRLRLAFNPSHLEFVGPVVLGQVRARQDLLRDAERTRVMPIILHGDAAFAGQGVVQELLNLSDLRGYRTGGAVHVIVNNQIGFTTDPDSSRSCHYATDVATMLRAPIFHVNGEHPESVAQVVQLAMDYRQRYRTDVFIDMYCYRRHGHNEGDEPSFTQPSMYRAIRERPTVRESYLGNLLRPGGLTQELADEILSQRTAFLEEELSQARSDDYQRPKRPGTLKWETFSGGPEAGTPEAVTAVPREALESLLRKTTDVPAGFTVFPKLRRILEQRVQMAAGERLLDWGAGEALAFATLLTQGISVRLSGQDCGRGTFSHRHAVLIDHTSETVHIPLQSLATEQGTFEVRNSPLSEAGVLGFDYGYALERPQGLVIWEAQFGDFVNGAQVIVDQFISSAEDKWDLLCGLVMLLPHGFEGQGPEHSSARLERFLQMCAEDNMQVVYPTTPAQVFHLLRRQVLRNWRKPLVVMSPKSLLRHPQAVSTLDELAQGRFLRVIPDSTAVAPVRRVLLCSGKLYYDLQAYRADGEKNDVEIVRIEQLYPFPDEELKAALADILEGDRGADGCEVVWVQEEPRNMGAWYYLRALHGESLYGTLPLRCVARDESASPATGSPSSHKREQQVLVTQAFWS